MEFMVVDHQVCLFQSQSARSTLSLPAALGMGYAFDLDAKIRCHPTVFLDYSPLSWQGLLFGSNPPFGFLDKAQIDIFRL